jgi:predicted nucleotidyltransferase
MDAMTAVNEARTREVLRLLGSVQVWARSRADLRAVALVGSWARGGARMDSDVDIVLLTEDVGAYSERSAWAEELGAVGIVRTQTWGVLIERRLAMPSGLEVEVGIAEPSWASTAPIDQGTATVAGDGLVALHDPDGVLGELARAVGDATRRGRDGGRSVDRTSDSGGGIPTASDPCKGKVE